MNLLLNLTQAEWDLSEKWLEAGLDDLAAIIGCSSYDQAMFLFGDLQARVKAAWKQAVVKLHPDRRNGNGALLAQINALAEMWRRAGFSPEQHEILVGSSRYGVIDNTVVTTKGVVRVVWK